MEGLDEIAEVIEAAFISDFRDGALVGVELAAGDFNTVIVQVIDGTALGHLLKKPAEIIGGKAGCICQVL